MGIEIKNNGLREYKIYKSDFGETESGILRGGAMFDTYEGIFYIDSSSNKIKGLKYEEYKIGNTKTNGNIKEIKMGVGNILKYILKNKEYYSEDKLLKELTIAYRSKIKKIINN